MCDIEPNKPSNNSVPPSPVHSVPSWAKTLNDLVEIQVRLYLHRSNQQSAQTIEMLRQHYASGGVTASNSIHPPDNSTKGCTNVATVEQDEHARQHGFPTWEAYMETVYYRPEPITKIPDSSTLRVDIPPPPMQ